MQTCLHLAFCHAVLPSKCDDIPYFAGNLRYDVSAAALHPCNRRPGRPVSRHTFQAAGQETGTLCVYRSLEAWCLMKAGCHPHCGISLYYLTPYLGTVYTPKSINLADENRLVKFLCIFDKPYTPNEGHAFDAALNQLTSLYSQNPAVGSPFSTGNNTSRLNPGYKRAAAIVGGQALRCAWSQTLTSFGVHGYAYITYPNAVNATQPQFGAKSRFIYPSTKFPELMRAIYSGTYL